MTLINFGALFLVLTATSYGEIRKRCSDIRGDFLQVPAGMKIEITDYQADSHSYVAINSDLPGEGNIFIAFEVLTDSDREFKSSLIGLKKKPQTLIGKSLIVRKDLPSLGQKGVNERRHCQK